MIFTSYAKFLWFSKIKIQREMFSNIYEKPNALFPLSDSESDSNSDIAIAKSVSTEWEWYIGIVNI